MSSIELVGRYLAERGRPTVFVPLALLIAETAWLAGPVVERSAVSFGLCAMQALLLILALRVWDDVQDRPRDALAHPDRITVRVQRVGPLAGLSAVLAMVAGLSLVGATALAARIAILAAIVLGLLVWYRTRPVETSRLGAVVLLAKYPALAIALAPGLSDLAPMRAVAAAGTLYLIACAYELLEDRHRGIS